MTQEVLGLLRARRITVRTLADRICSGRVHVQLVLSNVPDCGHQPRRKLAPHLTPEKLRALGWRADGSKVLSLKSQVGAAPAAVTAAGVDFWGIVPQRTIFGRVEA